MQGMASTFVFVHKEKKLIVVRRGDDFTALVNTLRALTLHNFLSSDLLLILALATNPGAKFAALDIS